MSIGERVVLGLLLLLVATAVGWGVERLSQSLLRAVARRTRWTWNKVLADSLSGILIVAAVVATLSWLTRWWELPPHLAVVADKLLLVAALLVGFAWLLRFSVSAVRYLLQATDGGLPSVSILLNVVRVGIILVATLIILQVLGIPVTPLLTALGIGGLAIALALQDTLSNLFSGLHVLAARQVRPGDFVQLDSGHEGIVEDINWRNTTIRTLTNNVVIIPNSRLANAVLVNYRVPQPELSIIISVDVAYGSDLEHVERVTTEVARHVQRVTPGAVRNFEPIVRFREFGNSGIRLSVVLRAEKAEDQYLVRHEFIKHLYGTYKAEAIEIPFPIRRLTGQIELCSSKVHTSSTAE
ncbi:MAG: mechanosensitive ion channel family protein [Candidatus Kapabacteria bacterium]|nr:mechanosensitive ion channel family protein [Candidatus Kapabacteria bacterium]MDW7997141.1 mechanosensitive ion channel family protein [Bacteroidota bacterium]